MRAHRSTNLGVLFLILAFVFVSTPLFAQSKTGGAGTASAETNGATSTSAAAGGGAGAGGTTGLSTRAIVGIAAGVAVIAGIAIAAGGGDGGTTAGHATAGH